MPPAPKKGGPGPKPTATVSTRDRRSSSRHSTPVSALTDTTAPPTPLAATPTTVSAPASATMMPKETAYLQTPISILINTEPTIEAILAEATAPPPNKGDPPGARELHALHDRIRDGAGKFMKRRGEGCDRSMRSLVMRRKQRAQAEREEELALAEAARVKKEDEERETKKVKKVTRKRSHDEMAVDGDGEGESEQDRKEKEARESLPSVGAHGLARQDGVDLHQGAPPPPSPVIEPGTAALDPMDTAEFPSDSDTSQNEPRSTIPLYERAFGKDPTKFDDPTIYDIRPLRDDMSDDEKRAVLDVVHWPESDLHDLVAGDPPDMDFSNAKPANQVNFSTFQTYVEPYIRPFTEEDVAFLKERGDRLTPYIVPQRGAKGYKEVWAAEDGLTGIEPPRPIETNPNEARGSMEDMDDATAETDEISMGPLMNRLMSLIRPGPIGIKKEDKEDADGDTSMVNGETDPQDTQPGAEEAQKPATYLPPDAPRPPNIPSLDYESMDQRAAQELRYLGLMTTTDAPDYHAHADDEVAARLRTLQHALRRVSRVNNVRRARVLELAEERMAMQEYSNIADDLDNQVNAAHLKRNRSLAKPGAGRKGTAAARLGQKGVAGVSGQGGRVVSDGVRALMQKRRDWIDMVGPVVSYGRPPVPGDGETVFDEVSMRRLEKAEREAEAGDVEAD